jgi:hypothetical protein
MFETAFETFLLSVTKQLALAVAGILGSVSFLVEGVCEREQLSL